MSNIAIRFPLFHTPEISIEFFPDELPEDHYDLIDCLRLELAPLKIWKQCALEYYKQGFTKRFDDILGDIVNELKNPEVAAAYRAKEDYAEGISEIYIVLAAKEILEFSKKKVVLTAADDLSSIIKRCLENLKAAEAEKLLNEYIWVLKGFFELLQGNAKRAEELFKMVLERVTKGQATKKKYLFVALIGLGMVAFSQNNSQSAIDYFSRAVTTHPTCHASVRTAIACCAFKLQQYDRSKLALHRANELDPADINQLVLQALLELAEAKKDRVNRAQLHQNAYEYLYLAHKIDSNHPSTLVLLANHDFHSWRMVRLEPKGYVISAERMIVPFEGYSEIFEMGNQVKLKNSTLDSGDTIHLIVNRKEALIQEYPDLLSSFSTDAKFYEIEFSPPFRSSDDLPLPLPFLEVKNLKAVVDAAANALSFTNLPAVKAECHYILGKVQHVHKNLTLAFEHYGKALQFSGDLAPAAFGAAQIYFARQDYANALKLFTDLLQGNQDDKDTLSYVKLLRGILHDEIAPIEKLREIAPGFQYEIDLWLSQAQLRHKRASATNNDFTEALKCFLYAKECYEIQQTAIPSVVLGNIANLYYLIGNYERALDYLKQTLKGLKPSAASAPTTHLVEIGSSSANSFGDGESMNGDGVLPTLSSSSAKLSDESLLYTCSDFENFFYQWTEKSVCNLQQDRYRLNRFFLSEGQSNLQKIFEVGEEILIQDMVWIVDSIPSANEILCKTMYGSLYQYQPFQRLREMKRQFQKEKDENKSFQLPSIAEMMEILSQEDVPLLLPVRRKEKWNNFHDQSLTYVYNLARIFEEMGNIQPAIILYRVILQVHSAHIDCLIRLSRIFRGLGKLPEAIDYLVKAKSICPDSVDINLTLGDLYLSSGLLEEAKKLFDEVYTNNRKDPQSLLAMGNYWYNTASKMSDENQNQLKTSYKFFHAVLTEHVRNAFAANGLGIVCATKGENDAAREIFSKIRQANMKHTEDTDINLANVYMSEKRYLEAERLYFSVLKNIPTNPSFQHYHYSHFLTLIGIAQYSTQKVEEAFKTLLKAWHMTPMEALVLFNFSIISNQIANMCIDRKQKASDEIDIIMNIVSVSIKILHYLSQSKKLIGQFDRKELSAKEHTAKERLRVLTEQFGYYAQIEKEQKEKLRQIEEEHQLRKQQRLEEAQQKEEAEISKRQENVDRILQQERRLEELRSKWRSRNRGDDDINDVEVGGGDDGAAKTKKRKRTNNNNTLDPSEKPKRKEKLKKVKKANSHRGVDNDQEPGRKRNQPIDSDESDNDMNDQDSTNSWLAELDKPSKLVEPQEGNRFDDSEDDIFGDADDDKEDGEAGDLIKPDLNEESQSEPSTNNNRIAVNDDDNDDL